MANRPWAETATATPVFFCRNIERFFENLILQRLLAEKTLQLADLFLLGAER